MIALSVREAISRFASQGNRIVAASVIPLTGSSPHAGGLALVVNDHGEIAGALSGGCVDGEVVEACEQVFKTNQSMQLQFGSDNTVFGSANLICGGKIEVWVYALSKEIIQAVIHDESCVFSINWPRDSQEPRQLIINHKIARSAACNNNHAILGINNQQDRAIHFLLHDRQRTCFIPLANNEKEFLERIGNKELVLIIGESAFTDMLCRLASMLNYEVIVCEPRPRFAQAIISADYVDESWPNDCIEKLMVMGKLNVASVIIVCTHDSKFDEPALIAALRSPAGFIGALGSRKTIDDRRMRLRAAGLNDLEIARIRSPLGFDLGGKTATETAVSVFSEIIAFKNKRSGKPLTELSGTIHGE